MKSNGMMEALLKGAEDVVTSADRTELEHCIDRLFRDIAFENGCLFMKTHNGRAVLNDGADKVGSEGWHNEILINSEFPEKHITAAFALEFFELFCERLKVFCPEKMCSIMSEDEGYWTFRFHIVREGEPLWISEDIEQFSQPVLYDIFGQDL